MMKNVVIVGGGSAGWLTAGILASELSDVTITLVESPNVPTIGVGEGTWPSMRATLQKIGLSENEFLTVCGASFKQGSKFVGWGTGSDVYYHPFMLPEGYLDANVYSVWRQSGIKKPFAAATSIQPDICDLGLAPKQVATPEYGGVLNYGYHLDAGKFVPLLQCHCVSKLSVRHVTDDVVGIKSATSGDIAGVETSSHGVIDGDLFIDCSGFSSLLLDRHFGVPFVKKNQYLFNDTALAIQIPYANESDAIASPTIATAQEAGWIWDIGLYSRRGAGYVYSSAHQSDEDAESCLRQYVTASVGESKAAELDVRKIKMTAGHRESFWYKNCVAVGMAAGFIEPLEASALALIELSANMIAAEFPHNRSTMETVASRFNQRFAYRWSRIVDFLKLHYVLTSRTDSEYWIDAKSTETTPDSLSELLSLWQYRTPNANDFYQVEEVFPSASYQYVLYGMGYDTQLMSCSDESISNMNASILEKMQSLESKLAGYQRALPSNRDLLTKIHQRVGV